MKQGRMKVPWKVTLKNRDGATRVAPAKAATEATAKRRAEKRAGDGWTATQAERT